MPVAQQVWLYGSINRPYRSIPRRCRRVAKYFHPIAVGKDITLRRHSFRFERAGHIGAAWVLLTAEKRTILFSGDLGRAQRSGHEATVAPVATDYLVVRTHLMAIGRHEQTHPLDQLEKSSIELAARGRHGYHPAFAVWACRKPDVYVLT